MKAQDIIERIAVSDMLTVTYHKHAEDRNNPDNGKFRSLSGCVQDLYAAKSGVLQVKMDTEDGVRSFTSEAIVKSLIINGLQLVKNYELV